MYAKKLVVSNTQVSQYAVCKKQHDYRFNMGIEPKPDMLTPALYRGIVGHEALEVYYTARMSGDSVEDSKAQMMNNLEKELFRITVEMPEDIDRIQLVADLTKLLDAYVERYRADDFKIIAVEQVFQAGIATNILYSMKLDLLVQHQSGPFRGDYEIIDHKFVYNFKSVAELEMDGQMPKYLKTLKENGFTISKGRFNQIRHRKIKDASMDQLFMRTPARLVPAKTETIWKEQIEWAEEIAVFGKTEKKRSLSFLTCKNCYFYEICNAEAMNQPVENLISTRYQPTTYGYTELGDDD